MPGRHRSAVGIPAPRIPVVEVPAAQIPAVVARSVEVAWEDDNPLVLRRATPADLPALRELFTNANDAPYDLAAVRATHARRDEILTFIEREFGRIWRFEVTPAFERASPPLFLTEEEGTITGFAAHDVNNRGLGFFGPTGVAQTMRGRGLGRTL